MGATGGSCIKSTLRCVLWSGCNPKLLAQCCLACSELWVKQAGVSTLARRGFDCGGSQRARSVWGVVVMFCACGQAQGVDGGRKVRRCVVGSTREGRATATTMFRCR
jgi:hypothetical protein